jgi:anti-sigma regulatory factor (Ser/Thr protein kinase)
MDIKNLPEKNYLTDGARINQVLSNLLSNAIKFTDKGFVKISGSIIKSKGKTDWVQFEITDSGIGIAKENSHLIFEEFARISSDDDKQYEGTGLGLAITKRIVELLNGTIRYTSNFGEGSSFVVVLPLQRQLKPVKTEPEKLTSILNGNTSLFNRERVLLVDDDPFLLELTTHILNEANLNVQPYSSAKKALKGWINNSLIFLLLMFRCRESMVLNCSPISKQKM